MALNLPQVPFKLTSEDMGIPDFGKAIQSGLQNYKDYQEAKYAAQTAKSNADYKTAMANYLSNPYQMQRFMTPTGKLLNEQMMSGLSSGNSEGASDHSNDISDVYNREILKTTTDPQQRANAQSAQILYNQVSDINTKPLEAFAGAGGKLRKLLEQGKGVASSFGVGSGPSKEFRDYNKYMSVNKNAIMDAIRQALRTSVVPGYVQSTLAPMVDPTSNVWNDPQQVRENIGTLKNWLKDYAGEQTSSYKKGVPTDLETSRERHKEFSTPSSDRESNININEEAHNLGVAASDIIGDAEHFGVNPEIVIGALRAGVKTEREMQDWIKGMGR